MLLNSSYERQLRERKRLMESRREKIFGENI